MRWPASRPSSAGNTRPVVQAAIQPPSAAWRSMSRSAVDERATIPPSCGARSGGWKACGEIGKSNGDIGMRRRRLPPLDFSHPPLLIVTMTLHRLALLPALMAVAFASQAAPDAKLLAAGQAAQPAVIDTLK